MPWRSRKTSFRGARGGRPIIESSNRRGFGAGPGRDFEIETPRRYTTLGAITGAGSVDADRCSSVDNRGAGPYRGVGSRRSRPGVLALDSVRHLQPVHAPPRHRVCWSLAERDRGCQRHLSDP